jgi:2,3-bisphosphoglycerate-dependent phosphoglycerate mutase
MSLSTGPRLLVLARHGQSEGNQRNIFTGWRDLPLTAQGEDEARLAGERLREMGVAFDAAFASRLSRASASCSLMLETMNQGRTPVESDAALNERDYGDLTGLNQDQARQQFGTDQVRVWRRSYAVAPPNGESLRDTIARVLPYYIRRILPAVMRSEAVLVVAHGNSLRSLILALEGLSPEAIPLVELGTAELRFYRLGEDTSATSEGTWSVPPT